MENVSVKAIFAGTCVCLLLLVMTPVGTAQQAELPTWEVGDTWAMGASDLDLAPLLQYVEENLRQTYAAMGVTDFSISGSGKLDIYEIYEVVEVQAERYKVSVSMGLEMDMSLDLALTMGTESGSGHLGLSTFMKADGFLYFTKDKLAAAEEDVSGTMEINMPIQMQAAGQTIDMTMKINANFEMRLVYDPPLDIFNFPITVGENWTTQSNVEITGTMDITVSTAGVEQSLSIPLDNTTQLSLPFRCSTTTDVTLEDGSTSTSYKIEYSMEGVGYTTLPLKGAFYYSPDRKFIVGSDLSMLPGVAGEIGTMALGGLEGRASLGSMAAVTEQEARDAIAGMGPKEGISIVLIGAIVAIVIVAIAAVLVVVRRRRA